MLVAKGADHMAIKIREIANEYDVPILAAPALARAIYFNTELEEEIPEGLYVAVAQVLAHVYQMKAATGQVPDIDADYPIPDELKHD